MRLAYNYLIDITGAQVNNRHVPISSSETADTSGRVMVAPNHIQFLAN